MARKAMKAVKAFTAKSRCGNCGRLIKDHLAVNFSDGNMISGTVPICPDAVFTELPAPRKGVK